MKKFGMKSLCLASLVCILFTLASCGNAKGKNTSKEKTNENKLEVSVGADYVEYVNKVKEDFEKEHDVEINVVEKDSFEQMDALSLDGPAGIGPDVTMAPFDKVGQGASQGYISEVTLPKDERFSKKDRQQVTVEEKIYGQPAAIESLVLYYNSDLLTEDPQTFQDLETISKDPKYQIDNKNVGFLAKWTDLYFAYGLIAGNGGYIFGENGQEPTDIGLNNKGAIEEITYAADWFQKIWPEGMLDVTANSNLISDYFTQGKTAAIISGPWDAANFKEAGLNFEVAPIPTLNNGKDYASFSGGKAWVISNFSKNKELANQFVDYLTSEACQDELYQMQAYIPANNASKEKIKNSEDQLGKAVINQYDVSQPMPNIPEMAEVWSGAQDMFFDAGSGNMTPKEAADNAVQTIKEAIEQKY